MKRFISIAAGTLGILASTAALADGMPRGGSVKDAAAAPSCGTSAYNWSGAFAGVQLGSSNYRSTIGVNDLLGIGGQREDAGLSVGGVIGYNMQRCNTVFGIEGEFNWVDNEARWGLDLTQAANLIAPGIGPVNLFNARSTMDWYGAIKLRTGFAFDNLLLYLTGGVAFANIEHRGGSAALFGVVPAGVINFNSSETRMGWVVGAGTEYALTNRITWRSEATYTRFEDQNFGLNLNLGGLGIPINGPLATLNAMDEVWRITTGLNFKF
jgi:outer membrane immunogenic protein